MLKSSVFYVLMCLMLLCLTFRRVSVVEVFVVSGYHVLMWVARLWLAISKSTLLYAITEVTSNILPIH